VRHYPELLSLVASGAVAPGALVRRRIALDEAGAALAAMGDGGAEGITVVDRF
jgi:alcohol dehydrogenase